MDKAKRDTPTTSKNSAIKKKVKGGAEKLRMKNLELLKDSARQIFRNIFRKKALNRLQVLALM